MNELWTAEHKASVQRIRDLYNEARQHLVKLRDAHVALIEVIPDIMAEAKRQRRAVWLTRLGIWIGAIALILNLLRLFL